MLLFLFGTDEANLDRLIQGIHLVICIAGLPDEDDEAIICVAEPFVNVEGG